jgi:hypothetical protein
MTIDTIEPAINVDNGMWGYQALPDLHEIKHLIPYIAHRGTTVATASFEDYGEQIVEESNFPFDKIEETLCDHERILKFLKGDLYKERDDVAEVVTPRVQELISDIEEDDDNIEPSSIKFLSFKNFIYFLIKNINVAIPSFVVTNQGNIRTLWRKSRKQHLAIEFHPDETVTYVIFAPNANRPEKIMRSSGTINQRVLYKVAVSLGADKWILKNEGQ